MQYIGVGKALGKPNHAKARRMSPDFREMVLPMFCELTATAMREAGIVRIDR